MPLALRGLFYSGILPRLLERLMFIKSDGTAPPRSKEIDVRAKVLKESCQKLVRELRLIGDPKEESSKAVEGSLVDEMLVGISHLLRSWDEDGAYMGLGVQLSTLSGLLYTDEGEPALYKLDADLNGEEVIQQRFDQIFTEERIQALLDEGIKDDFILTRACKRVGMSFAAVPFLFRGILKEVYSLLHYPEVLLFAIGAYAPEFNDRDVVAASSSN